MVVKVVEEKAEVPLVQDKQNMADKYKQEYGK